MLKAFRSSLIATVIGLPLCAWIGFQEGGTSTAALEALFIGAVLAVLEISLSFDNAIVNASILKKMTPEWRHRFLTWGILIAVFGMRLIFPLAIVSVTAWISPWAALKMAITSPLEYTQLILLSHHNVAAFGGCFLMMVALDFFIDGSKHSHWIAWLEKPLSKGGRWTPAIITALFLGGITWNGELDEAHRASFLISGVIGILTFKAVSLLNHFLENWGQKKGGDLARASLGLFIYVEVLDASFSFDGVVGAFAITHSLWIMMIGLGIGAFFVRGLTISFVEKETLSQFDFLEHGAFYAIAALAVLMICDPISHIPEWVTGLIGAVIIALAFYSSLKKKKILRSTPPPLK